MKPPILMIHGAFCGGWCFDGFRDAFDAVGHWVAAPDLPGHGPGDPPSAVVGLSLVDYAKAVVRAIDACPTPPVLLGHSMGGLVAQLAAARRPVAGLILLAPSPAWGQPVTSAFDLAAGFALAALRGPYWAQAIEPDYPIVRAATLNRVGEDAARALFRRMKAESGRALYEILNWWLDPTLAAAVPPTVSATPALVISGGADQVHSPSTVAATAARLGVVPHLIPELSHWTMGEPGSERVTALCLEWLETQTHTSPLAGEGGAHRAAMGG